MAKDFCIKKKNLTFFSGRDLLGPLLRQGEQEQTTNSLAGSLSEGVGPGSFLHGVRVECARAQAGGWLRWCCVQGASAAPCFCSGRSSSDSGLQKRQFEASLHLLSKICPHCAYRQLFLIPYSFLVFRCLRRGVFRYKHCSTSAKDPDPNLSHSPKKTLHPYSKGVRGSRSLVLKLLPAGPDC